MNCNHKFEHYEGFLGYESEVCKNCKQDINDIKAKLQYDSVNGVWVE